MDKRLILAVNRNMIVKSTLPNTNLEPDVFGNLIKKSKDGVYSQAADRLFGLNTDQWGQILGQIAQAIMGPNQNTWQAGIGRIGEQMGEQGIFSNYLQ